MSLESLVDNSRTDKNTLHSYLPVYEHKLAPRRETAKKVLEIGIQRGGSLKLWADYFPNAEVYGLDIQNGVPDCCKGNPRIRVLQGNAYDIRAVKEFLNKGMYFDVIIDDGSHTLDAMVFFTKYYSQLLAPGGVLICEDIPTPDWLDAIHACTPSHFKKYAEAYDLRSVKGRHDDILYIVDHRVEKAAPGLAGARLTFNS